MSSHPSTSRPATGPNPKASWPPRPPAGTNHNEAHPQHACRPRGKARGGLARPQRESVRRQPGTAAHRLTRGRRSHAAAAANKHHGCIASRATAPVPAPAAATITAERPGREILTPAQPARQGTARSPAPASREEHMATAKKTIPAALKKQAAAVKAGKVARTKTGRFK